MFVMTAKVQKKKIAILLGAVVALALLLVIALGGGKRESTASEIRIPTNDDRVQFVYNLEREVV